MRAREIDKPVNIFFDICGDWLSKLMPQRADWARPEAGLSRLAQPV